MLETTRRFLSIAALALWLGGVIFYGGVVVPAAHDISGSHREVGFVTRRVTGRLNEIAVFSLGLLLWNTWAEARRGSNASRIVQWTSWGMMLISLVALFLMRSSLDGMLDPLTRSVLDRPRFRVLHERYLNVTSILCLAALVHLWTMIRGFGHRAPEPPP